MPQFSVQSTGMEGRMFPSFSEKILRSRVAKAAWCPTSDLAAIVFVDNSIALCRDGVSPIWTLPAPNAATVNCLAWNPQGTELVVGSSDGTVTRIDARSFEPKCTTCWPAAAAAHSTRRGVGNGISALAWVTFSREQEAYLHGFDPSVLDFTEVLPPLSMVPPDEPSPLIPNQRVKKPPLPDPPTDDTEDQTLLLIGDEGGHVHLCLNGTFHIGSFSTKSKGAKDAAVVAIDANSSISELQVLSRRKTPEGDEAIFSSIQCDLLHTGRKELCNIAAEYGHILFLLKYLRQCVHVLAKHHTTITNLAKANATKISDLLLASNDQTDPMPQVELLGLIATGNPCEAVYEYFTQLLSEQQLKRWTERASHSYSCSQLIVCEYLQPACERLLLHLNTLHGYSLWPEQYGKLLDESAVALCTEKTKQMMQHLTVYLADVTKVSLTFSDFMKWMSNMFYKFVGEGGSEAEVIAYDPWRAVEHIRSSFASDSLAHYFANLPTPESKQGAGFLCMVEGISLACRSMLEQPATAVAAHVAVAESHVVNLGTSKHDTDITRFSTSRMDENQTKQHFAFIQSNDISGDKVILIETDLTRTEPPAYAALSLADCHITDYEFLDDEEMALVCEYPGGTLLSTFNYNAVQYAPFRGKRLEIDQLQECHFTRSMSLEKTKNAAIGANGRPRRRTIGVYRANRKASSYFLDE